MQKVFQEYGGVIMSVLAIVGIIGCICVMCTPYGTGWMDGAFNSVIGSLNDKAGGAIDGLENRPGGGSGGSVDEEFVPGLYQTGAIDFYNTHGTSLTLEKNVYGFYFGAKYSLALDGTKTSYVFYEDGSAELFENDVSQGTAPIGTAVYADHEITLMGDKMTVSADGTQLSVGGVSLMIEYTEIKLSDMLIMSWDELVDYGYMTVTDGVLTHTATSAVVSTYDSYYECALDGELILPSDESITSIGEEAFHLSCVITGILLPDSVSNIDAKAFQACERLTLMSFAGTTSDWNAISFGEDWNLFCPEITVTCTDGTVTVPTIS